MNTLFQWNYDKLTAVPAPSYGISVLDGFSIIWANEGEKTHE
jgi:hypothetical protein